MGSAGPAACQVYGTSTQRAPSREPVEQLSKTTIVVESPTGTLERSNLQVSPRLPLSSGVRSRVAHRGYVVARGIGERSLQWTRGAEECTERRPHG